MGPVIVAGTIDVAAAIIAESSLSFLGLGFPPDIPTWGRILFDAKDNLDFAPHWAIFPGTAIFLTVLSINYIGDGLRDALDPRKVLSSRKAGEDMQVADAAHLPRGHRLASGSVTDRDLCFVPATALQRLYRARKVSPLEVMQAVLARIDAVNPRVNAYVTVARESALAGARKATAALTRRARWARSTASRSRSRT